MPRRPMTIEQALIWAFATERAQLDFDEAKGDNARPGISPLWTVMQRGRLGCTIDGGGHSLPAHDADIIASAVAHLPAALGGRGMGITVAEHARAASRPDWTAPPPRCVPVAWKGRHMAHGPDAVTEKVGTVSLTNRGRKVDFPVLACPVRYTSSAAQISAARARYTAWRAALAHLLQDLWVGDCLSTIALHLGLPPAAPWDQAIATPKAA